MGMKASAKDVCVCVCVCVRVCVRVSPGGKDGRVVALDMRALGRPSPSQDPGTQGCGVMHTLETCKGRGYPQQASIEQVRNLSLFTLRIRLL